MLSLSTFNPRSRSASTNGAQSANGATRQRVLVTPAADIIAHEKHYELRLALPGVALDNVQMVVEKGLLVIDASDSVATPENTRSLHREFGGVQYRRSFSLNEEIDESQISASLRNGILSITLPKRAEVAARKIAISGE